MKITTIIGARPQFIKAAVVSRALRAQGLQEVLVHTGQHYDDNMSEIFFDELELPAPAINLGIGTGKHGEQTGRMLEAIECHLLADRPDWVIVYGDTNSTLAGALAAAKLQIKVAHVEAGLRSFNREMPEEINRVLTDHVSDLYFAPTATAVENLVREGIPSTEIHHYGDVMYDAALYYAARAQRYSQVLEQQQLQPKRYLLVTIHRAENTDRRDRLECLCSSLMQLADEIPVIFPLHPRTKAALAGWDMLNKLASVVRLTEPVGYLDMMMLEKNASVIVTDSGGVQKEAFFYQVPCVTARQETEWVELVAAGWNRLVPPVDSTAIVETVRRTIESTPPPAISIYGDGHSAERIAQFFHSWAETKEFPIHACQGHNF